MSDATPTEAVYNQEVALNAQRSVEQRRDRYAININKLESLNAESFYPPEMRKREWEEIRDGEEFEEFIRPLPSELKVDSKLIDKLAGVYRDKETGRLFISPFTTKGGVRQIVLDMLATTAELAPYSDIKGMMIVERSNFFQPNSPGVYTFQSGMVQLYPAIVEDFINSLGDERYSNNQRAEVLMEDIAGYVHETVHSHNNSEAGPGEPSKLIMEVPSTITEYLCFPGKNDKLDAWATGAFALLENKGDEPRLYTYHQGLLVGMILAARESGFVTDEDKPESLAEGLKKWKAHVDALPRPELEAYRRTLEEKYWLSDNEEKLLPVLRNLKAQYPDSLGHLKILSLREVTSLTPVKAA